MSGAEPAPPAAPTHGVSNRPRPWLGVTAVVATLWSLVLAAFCLFLANLITYGLYSWTEVVCRSTGPALRTRR
jgi:hypothetical protein